MWWMKKLLEVHYYEYYLEYYLEKPLDLGYSLI